MYPLNFWLLLLSFFAISHGTAENVTDSSDVALGIPHIVRYVVTFDCYLYTNDSIAALKNNTKPCESLTSAYYQTSTAGYTIFINYENEKEISLAVLPVNSLKDNDNLQPYFTKISYEHILGNCSFDKTVLSAGIDADILYITVSCGNSWAFMRTVLFSDSSDILTPFGPLIHFNKGDDTFTSVLFVPASRYENGTFSDAIVLRYKTEETFLSYFGTYLHQLNHSAGDIHISRYEAGTVKLFAESTELLLLEPGDAGTLKLALYTRKPNNITTLTDYLNVANYFEPQKSVITGDFDTISHIGFAPISDTTGPYESVWKYHDDVINQHYKAAHCLLKPAKSDVCSLDEDKKYIFYLLYIVAGAEILLVLGTIIAFILYIIWSKKKSSNLMTNREVTVNTPLIESSNNVLK